MRDFRTFFRDIIRKPPILFPLIGLFHIFLLIWTIWDDRHEPFPDIAWLQFLWVAVYTIFWIAACDLRKWGALGYILTTIANTSIYLAVRNHKMPDTYLSNLFLIDGLFSVFLVFYYKRFS